MMRPTSGSNPRLSAPRGAGGSSGLSSRSSLQHRRLGRFMLGLSIAVLVYHLAWRYYLAGVNISDTIEIDGKLRTRRKPDKMKKYDHDNQKHIPTEPFDGVMEGHLTLMNLRMPLELKRGNNGEEYSGVKGIFCHIAWAQQAEDPSKVPMFKDLKEQSLLCEGTTHVFDLHTITRQAIHFDHKNHTFAATEKEVLGSTPPTAVVFHETRCGSTLVANLFAAFTRSRGRVYSESPPPIAALKACEQDRVCDSGAQEALIRDVFYMMGRTERTQKPQFMFYKIQSVGSHHIDIFQKAMPHTPWMYIYRDSVEVMMSHFKNYQHGNPLSKDFMPVCLRNYGNAWQPPQLEWIVKKKSRTIDSLNQEEYCAAHLASLCKGAIDAHMTATAPNYFINYAELPYKIWETVLPKLIGSKLSTEELDKMHAVSHFYSKGRGKRAGESWHEDGSLKQNTAPDSVKAASGLFLDGMFQKMERYEDP